MPSRFPLSLQTRDRRIAASVLAALTILASVAALAPALASTPDPTSAPDAVGRVYANQSWVGVQPQLVWNLTYDLTFTNLTESVVEGTPVSIVAPGGRVADTRAAYADGSTTGAYNVTFPGLFPGAAGSWLLVAEGMANRTFHVNFTSDYNVTLSQSKFEESYNFITFTISVVHATYGYAISGAQVHLDGTYLGVTNSEGRYVYSGPTPSVGTHSVTARRDLGGDSQPEVLSWTHLTVVAAAPEPPVVSVSDAAAAPTLTDVSTVRLHDVVDFGTLTLDVRYNASIVRVANVTTPAGGPNLTLWWHDDAANGTLRLLVTGAGATPGPSGTFDLAHLELQAAGPAGSTSPLDATVVEAAHSNGTLMSVVDRDGTFRSGLSGDADADGDVDQDDLKAIVREVLGEPGAQVDAWGADLNRDGRVSGIDAMLLEQRLLAATRSTTTG